MILVVGATGRLGGAITRRLLGQGHAVRILVRPGSDHGRLVEAGAQPVFGDLKDPGTLRDACAGVESVITTANAAGRGAPDTFDSVDDRGNHDLIRSATAAGVQRFLFISALGADPSSPMPLLRAKGLTEARLRGSGMAFTIVQPDAYMDLLIPLVLGPAMTAGQPVTLVGEGRRVHSFVALDDVAELAVRALDHPASRNAVIPIGGPRPLSWRDIVATAERVSGRDISVRVLPPGEPVPNVPEFVTGLLTALELYDTPLDSTSTAATYGLTLTAIDTWLAGLLVALTAEPRAPTASASA